MNTDWQTLLAVDFDKWAAATYAANFPGVDVRCGPVADFLDGMPQADVVIGGPPCQPFSDAGENEGERDERDGMPDFIEAVRRANPRQFLMENVRGLLKEKHLPYFGRVLGQLESLGYRVEYRVLDAVSFGVPQFRERVFAWGLRSDLVVAGARHRWPQATHAWPPPEACMFGAALLPGVTVGEALGIEDPIRRMRGRGMADRPGERRDHPPSEPAPTVAASKGGGGTPLYRVIGGGTNPHYAGQTRTERDIADEPSTTIAAQHTHNALPAVVECRWSDALYAKHSPASPAPTLRASIAKGRATGALLAVPGPDQRVVVIDGQNNAAYPVDRPCGTIQANAQAKGGQAGHHLAVVDAPSHTLSGQSREPIQGWKDKGYVRRLTPLECLRLQSGPDAFRWPDGITKTAMYRVVGNGWSCKVGWEFSKAFKLADPTSRTVIDLFCGGGLGASGWHGKYWSYEPAGKAVVA